jgi:putative regulatory protein, FmdB family
MPTYTYQAKNEAHSCRHCREGFDAVQKISDAAFSECPECGAAVAKVPVASNIGRLQSSFDDRAKSAGFSKLKKVSKGEYEKQY